MEKNHTALIIVAFLLFLNSLNFAEAAPCNGSTSFGYVARIYINETNGTERTNPYPIQYNLTSISGNLTYANETIFYDADYGLEFNRSILDYDSFASPSYVTYEFIVWNASALRSFAAWENKTIDVCANTTATKSDQAYAWDINISADSKSINYNGIPSWIYTNLGCMPNIYNSSIGVESGTGIGVINFQWDQDIPGTFYCRDSSGGASTPIKNASSRIVMNGTVSVSANQGGATMIYYAYNRVAKVILKNHSSGVIRAGSKTDCLSVWAGNSSVSNSKAFILNGTGNLVISQWQSGVGGYNTSGIAAGATDAAGIVFWAGYNNTAVTNRTWARIWNLYSRTANAFDPGWN